MLEATSSFATGRSSIASSSTGAGAVHARVLGDLVHALADADARGEVNDVVDAIECTIHRCRITDIPDLQLDFGIQVVRALAGAVHLLDQAVQCPHLVAQRQQVIGNMGPDESGSARDQDSSRHVSLPSSWGSKLALCEARSFFIYPSGSDSIVSVMTPDRL